MITSFDGEYSFLSNFYPCKVKYRGIIYPSVEHAYVAAKTADKELQIKISKLATPGHAKRFGKTIDLVENWDRDKVFIMDDLLEQKFSDPILNELLMGTAPHELIEGNTWGDRFWGQCPLGDGKNMLGKLLMSIRDDVTRML